jgi:hypothetical protein
MQLNILLTIDSDLWLTVGCLQSQSYVTIDVQSVCLGVIPHLELKTRFLLQTESCGFVDVGRPL